MSTRKKILLGFLVFIFLIFAILTSLTLPLGEKWIQQYLSHYLSEKLKCNVSIGRFETNLISRIQIWHLSVSFADQTSSDSPFISLAYGEIRGAFWKLLLSKVDLREILLDSFVVDLRSEPETKITALSDWLSSSRESPSLLETLQLDYLEIKNSHLEYQSITLPISTTLQNFSLQLRSEAPSHWAFTVHTRLIALENEPEHSISIPLLMEGTLTSRDIQIHQVTAQLPEGRLYGKMQVDFSMPSPGISGEFAYRGSLAFWQKVMVLTTNFQPISVRGNVHAQFNCSGRLDSLAWNASLSAPHLISDALEVKEVEIIAGGDQNHFQLEKLQFQTLGGKLFGSGSLALEDSAAFSIGLDFQNFDLSKAWYAAYREPSPYQGQCDGRIILQGHLNRLRDIDIHSRFRISHFVYEGRPLSNFEVLLAYHKNRGRLTLTQGANYLNAQLHIRDNQLQGGLEILFPELAPLAGFLNLGEVQGTLSGEGTIAGTLDNPTFEGAIQTDNLTFEGLPFSRIHARLKYTNKKLNILENHFQGQLNIEDSTNAPFQLQNIRGNFRYSGHFQGDLQNLRGKAQLSFQKALFQNMSVDSGAIFSTLTGDTFLLQSWVMPRPDFKISGNFIGSLAEKQLQGNIWLLSAPGTEGEARMNESEPSFGARLTASQASWGEISVHGALLPQTRVAISLQGKNILLDTLAQKEPGISSIGGILNFHLLFEGDQHHPQASVMAAIQRFRRQGVNWDSLTTALNIQNNLLTISHLKLFLGENVNWIRGKVILPAESITQFSISPEIQIDLQTEAKNFPLNYFTPLLGTGKKIEGKWTHQLQIRGTLRKPKMRGNISLNEGAIRWFPDAPVLENVSLNITFSGNQIILEEAQAHLKQHLLSASGAFEFPSLNELMATFTLQLANQKVVDLQAHFKNLLGENSPDLSVTLQVDHFPLTTLQPFTPQVTDLKGNLSGRMDISGTLDTPDIRGHLQVSPIAIRWKPVDFQVMDGILQMHFQQNEIFLDSLALKANGGMISARGSSKFQDGRFTEVAIKCLLTDLSFRKQGTYHIVLSRGELQLLESSKGYVLSGDMVLGESRFTKNITPKSILNWVQSRKVASRESPGLLERVHLDVRIRDSERLWIDNNLARLRLHSQLSLQGTLNAPRIQGRLNVEEGYVLYLDRKFKITEGTIDFIDPNRINPILKIAAVTQVQQYRQLSPIIYEIMLSLQGPLDRLEVNLTSTPPLDKSDILALLTVGTTREQIASRENVKTRTNVEEVLRDRFLGLTSYQITNYFTRRVSNLLALDEVSIEGSIFRRHQRSGPQLLASKRITSRANLTYYTTVGRLNDQGVRLEYRISRYLSVEGQTDQKNRTGIDLKFQLKFK